jgi:micrococcal nuclease
LKKELIPKPEKKYQISGKNNVPFLLEASLVLILIISLAVSACGLFYEYPEDLPEANRAIDEIGEDYLVTEVVDGDTVILETGEHIRLLGINTPEGGMYFYQESKEVLEAMVLDKTVRLEKDVTDLDIYGRQLRYIFLDSLFINLEMIQRGFANIYTNPPDVKYAEEFLEAERYARENNLGLWELSDLKNIRVELVYDSPGNDNENINGEYVVLENTGSIILDIAGWTIKDSGTNIYRFGPYEFYPGSRIIIYSGMGRDSGSLFYWNSTTPVWNNDSDTLYLRDGEGLLISIYNY